jgi:arylsulfatase A-like enzyme
MRTFADSQYHRWNRSVALRLVLAALCAASLACAGCKPYRTEPPSIILVSIDSLRRDNLGCYGYQPETSPFLDELAAEGIRFDNAISTTSWTLPAHAAMMTGLYDSTHGLLDNGLRLGEGHLTLAELLAGEGYQTAGFFGGPYLHPTFGLGQGFETYQSCMTTTHDKAPDAAVRHGARAPSGLSHADVTGPRTRAEVTAWAQAGVQEPYFLFLHMWDVHYDYIPPQEYVERFDPDYDGEIDGSRFSTDERLHAGMPERDLRHLIALYDGEIRFTDDTLREIFGELKSRGLLTNTLVVVTADHGEEFFEHNGKGHQRTLFDEVLRVPLIVWWPGTLPGGTSISDQVRLIDLMPTLAFYAGVDQKLVVQGRNLAPLLEGGSLPPEPALAELLAEGLSIRALRTNEVKAMRFRDDLPAILLRLDVDPGEQLSIQPGSPLEDERRQYEAQLQETLQRSQTMNRMLRYAQPELSQPDPVLLRRLQELGYLE